MVPAAVPAPSIAVAASTAGDGSATLPEAAVGTDGVVADGVVAKSGVDTRPRAADAEGKCGLRASVARAEPREIGS